MRIHHLALRVTDIHRSLAFYRDVLGLTVSRCQEDSGELRSVWLQAGETLLMLELTLRGAGAEVGSGHLLAFEIDDLDAWEARLASAGVAVDDRTSHTIYLRDPDGHRVGLSRYREV